VNVTSYCANNGKPKRLNEPFDLRYVRIATEHRKFNQMAPICASCKTRWRSREFLGTVAFPFLHIPEMSLPFLHPLPSKRVTHAHVHGDPVGHAWILESLSPLLWRHDWRLWLWLCDASVDATNLPTCTRMRCKCSPVGRADVRHIETASRHRVSAAAAIII